MPTANRLWIFRYLHAKLFAVCLPTSGASSAREAAGARFFPDGAVVLWADVDLEDRETTGERRSPEWVRRMKLVGTAGTTPQFDLMEIQQGWQAVRTSEFSVLRDDIQNRSAFPLWQLSASGRASKAMIVFRRIQNVVGCSENGVHSGGDVKLLV